MKYLLLLSMLFSSFGYSHKIGVETGPRKLKDEVRQLSLDIKRLEQRIIDLQLYLSNNSDHSRDQVIWGCYINDISAGGILKCKNRSRG